MAARIQQIPLAEINVLDGQRELGHLEGLMDSIQLVDLLEPILVVPEGAQYRLIAGWRRLNACQRLGWLTIEAKVLEMDDLQAELATIDENLIRQELTHLERSEQRTRRKEIYEALHPETKRRNGPGRGHTGKKRKAFASFADDTASKTSQSPRTIQQEVQIATDLRDGVKEKIRALPIADKKSDLLLLARLPQETQEAVADQLASGRATSVREAQQALNDGAVDPDTTLNTGLSPQGQAPDPRPVNVELHREDRDTLLHTMMTQFQQSSVIVDAQIAGRPAAEVMAHRLAALPRPEIVRGWPVLPCHGIREGRCTCGGRSGCHPGKHPRTSHDSNEATTDPQRIHRCWTDQPDANVAIATGAASGLIIVDLDRRHGGDLTLGDLEAQYDKLPDTVVSLTGGGGTHYFFRHFGTALPSRAHALGPGLDIKADGGYIIAPPSLHASGLRYAWEVSSHPDAVRVAAVPAWVWMRATTMTRDVMSTALIPSPLLLEGKPVHIYGGAGSPTREEITHLFKDPAVALACARALDVATTKIGQPFRCVLHDERYPSASLHWDPKTGALKYRDWHRKGGEEWYTLADVYASKVAGREIRLQGPSMASRFLRLLVDAGIYRPVPVPARRLPSTVRPAVRHVYEGFLLLLGCKWLRSPGDPTTFTWRFAADWCRISERHAGESIRWLLKQSYIQPAGKYKRMALFLPVPPPEEAC